MFRQVILTAVLGVALTSTAALTQDCRVGPGLGSSLLIPYFEVDMSDPAGLTTLFSVNNEFGSPAVARVVLWTDWGIPTLGFDLFLEPRALTTINVRDLFNGNIPSTGDSSDLSGFPFCESAFFTPVHANPALSGAQIGTFRAFHRGEADPVSGMCAGQLFGDTTERGYITVDVVDECSGVVIGKAFSPADSSFPYFSEGGASDGIAIVSNRLWGDFFIVDPSEDAAQGSEAVSIWADASRFTSSDEFTFYGRFEGYTATDERVPLPDLWASRFLNGGAFTGGTDFIVWRDVGTAEADPISCGPGFRPSWFPLNTSFVTARDEAGENPAFLSDSGSLPLATQRLSVADFSFAYPFGRVQFGLADGPGLSGHRQAWMQTIMSAEGRFSLGMNATPVNELCGVSP